MEMVGYGCMEINTAGSEKDAVAGLGGLSECCGGQRHSIETVWPGIAAASGQNGLFLFWIGPLSLECRSIAVCLCPELGLGMG